MKPLSDHRRLILSSLAALATVLAVQSLVWPRRPSVAPLNASAIGRQLSSHGFAASRQQDLPAQRSQERARSVGLVFSLGQGQTLRLARGVARERDDFALAFLTSDAPALKLLGRSITSDPTGMSARGRIGTAVTRQTCLVIGPGQSGGFGVTNEELLAVIDPLPRDLRQRVESLLGLRLARAYECAVISLSASDPAMLTDPHWSRLLQVLRPVLASGGANR